MFCHLLCHQLPSQVLQCTATTSADTVLHFLAGVRVMPNVHFAILDVDTLASHVRDVLAGYILDPRRPLSSSVSCGLVLVFGTNTGKTQSLVSVCFARLCFLWLCAWQALHSL